MLPRLCPGFHTIAIIAALAVTSGSSQAVDYAWSATDTGSWTNGLNWGNAPTVYPNSPTDRATFNTPGNTTATTVTLDTPITIRRLIFGANQTGALTIAPGAGGTLTFDNLETGQPSLNV